MAFDDTLIQYGAIGVVLLYLMWKDQQVSNKWASLIENNTVALTKVADKLEGCPGRKQ